MTTYEEAWGASARNASLPLEPATDGPWECPRCREVALVIEDLSDEYVNKTTAFCGSCGYEKVITESKARTHY